MAAKIRKGDKVVVLSGSDKGRTGEVIEVHAAGRARAGAWRQHGQAPPEADRAAGGRHHLQGAADPSVERGDGRSQGRQADPRRLQVVGNGDGRKVRFAKRSGVEIDG